MAIKKEFNKHAFHPLQTWEWGDFRKETGNEIVRFDDFQITLHKIPKTKYKVAALIRGQKPTPNMLKKLKDYARENKVIFIKLEPFIRDDKKIEKLLRDNGAVKGRTLFTPTSFWIDLQKSEEELMKGFHSKTRYNIRKAIKSGVKVEENNTDQAFEKYIKLTRETVSRQKFYAHNEQYHRLMWKILHTKMVEDKEKPIARLLTAKYKNEIITTWILFVWKDFLYYPYGASSQKYKNIMANNLVMWEAIKLGKKLGCHTFDLWGREEGKGFTKFKEGYNPEVIEFIGTWDLPTSKLYWPYRILETGRWIGLRLMSRLRRPKF